MAPQRAGQKRKVVEVARPEEETIIEADDDGKLVVSDGAFDDGASDSETEENEGEGESSDELDEEEEEDEEEDSEDSEDAQSEDGQQKDFHIIEDANGNERFVYREIDAVYDSDDSDNLAMNNTIGDIPLSYYDAYPHIGYDINGQKIARPAKGHALDQLLDSIDIPDGWTGLTDPQTGKPLHLTADQLNTLKQLTRNERDGEGYDPYPDMVEYFTGKGMEMLTPLTAAPEPKRRFVPSMHEHKRVMKMVKAIKDGRIRPFREQTDEERERQEAEDDAIRYDVWADEAPRPDHVMNVPAPKLPPPGYEESYHPPPEYLPDQHEREAWEQQDEEDRDRPFLPQDHTALRKVPGYATLVKEKFERCLDLYLAPRVRRSKLNIDPESLLPKLPDPAELKPFPTTCTKIFTGHEGRVRSVAVHPAGRYVASGGDDGTVRVWDLQTSRQAWRVRLSSTEPVNVVTWRPGPANCILGACCAETVYLIVPELDSIDPETLTASFETLDAGFGYAASNPKTPNTKSASGKDKSSAAQWSRPPSTLQDKGIVLTLTLLSAPKTLVWHRRGEYFSTVTPHATSSTSTSIAIHTLSKHQTQFPFRRLKGLAQTVCFHPSKPLFFVATRQRVRIYDLQAQKMEKELTPGARWISSISLHPQGSHLLVSSYDKRLLWHDLDLGATPYKTLRYHTKAIRDVSFHPSHPLFVDASDDGTLQVFHGKVVGDSLENATIVPLKVLRGHHVKKELGVLSVAWHPKEAWVVSGGSDGGVRVWT